MERKEILQSKIKPYFFLAGSLAFVALGGFDFFVSAEPSTTLWACLIFFGLCSLVFVVIILRPQKLVLDQSGFRLVGGLVRRHKKVPWSVVDHFFVCHLPRGGKQIGFKYGSEVLEYRSWRAFSKATNGVEAAIPGIWAMAPELIVQELNDFRRRALQSTEISGVDSE